jgi:hypothetical protein
LGEIILIVDSDTRVVRFASLYISSHLSASPRMPSYLFTSPASPRISSTS